MEAKEYVNGLIERQEWLRKNLSSFRKRMSIRQ